MVLVTSSGQKWSGTVTAVQWHYSFHREPNECSFSKMMDTQVTLRRKVLKMFQDVKKTTLII